ncbi:MAG TPA: non-canonical purine NTP pyrophosphatase [Candidatus Saccharimonadales bacterium]|nr:non-canonical purine NTP pyrophosphatase [Candidatus Saccharimonadales bacterium]
MQRIPVDSSDVVSVGYDAKTRLLEVEFGGGRVYQYTEVPADVHERFMRADSYGTYFNTFINGHYRYTQLNEEKKAAPQAVAFVTGNPDKLRALKAACDLFDIPVEAINLPVDEIQGHDAEAIAIHKAKESYRLAGRPVVVQDTYWNILALRGFPGAYMHDVGTWLRPEDFLALMAGKGDRTVIRTHTVVYYDGKRSKVFSKDFFGEIAPEARGPGNPVDQIIITKGQTRTNAELYAEGGFAIPVEESVWHDFAKWYHMQRRLRKV